MSRLRDDGIPIRGGSEGLAGAANSIAKLIVITCVVVAVIGVIGAGLWIASRREVALAVNPSHEMNHKELVAYLQKRGVKCYLYEGHDSVFGTYCDISTDSSRLDSDPCVRVWKMKAEREAHDRAGVKGGAFDWGLFVFEQRGDAGELLQQIHSAISRNTVETAVPENPAKMAQQNAALTRLEGEWEWTRRITAGEIVSPNAGPRQRFTIRGDRMTYNDIPNDSAIVLIDPFTTPSSFDLRFVSGKVSIGVYELEGDTLTLCFAAPGEGRPMEIKSTKAPATDLWILKRRSK